MNQNIKHITRHIQFKCAPFKNLIKRNFTENEKTLHETKCFLNRHLLINYCFTLSNTLKGDDGCGLTGGAFIDMIITDFFQKHVKHFEKFRSNESDFKIKETPYSFKKINGKSIIALDWSKNKTNSQVTFLQTSSF